MNAQRLPFLDQIQLLTLRWLTVCLALVDALLRVDWGERLLDRLSRRWERQLAEVSHRLKVLEREREEIHVQLEALAIQVAAVHLGARRLARGELRFDPADPQDERILDASIDLLVKRKLAAIETEEVEPGHYVYILEPNWGAIRACLADAAEVAPPDIADWLEEGGQYIDETCRAL